QQLVAASVAVKNEGIDEQREDVYANEPHDPPDGERGPQSNQIPDSEADNADCVEALDNDDGDHEYWSNGADRDKHKNAGDEFNHHDDCLRNIQIDICAIEPIGKGEKCAHNNGDDGHHLRGHRGTAAADTVREHFRRLERE
ncbi:hypothetical protein PENTCL1PPCAC_15562, partial [Pristionchus entomophagus]